MMNVSTIRSGCLGTYSRLQFVYHSTRPNQFSSWSTSSKVSSSESSTSRSQSEEEDTVEHSDIVINGGGVVGFTLDGIESESILFRQEDSSAWTAALEEKRMKCVRRRMKCVRRDRSCGIGKKDFKPCQSCHPVVERIIGETSQNLQKLLINSHYYS